METQLYLRTMKRTYIPESEWNNVLRFFDKKELDIHFIVLKVVLLNSKEEEVILEDIMEPLIQNLCLRSSKELLLGNNYSFNYWDYPGIVNMNIKGEQIVLDGDLITTTCFFRNELLQALLIVAQKVMELMKMLSEKYPEYDFSSYSYFKRLFEKCSELRGGDSI